MSDEVAMSQCNLELRQLSPHLEAFDEKVRLLANQRVSLVSIDQLEVDELVELVNMAGEPGSDLHHLFAGWRWCSKLLGSHQVFARFISPPIMFSGMRRKLSGTAPWLGISLSELGIDNYA